MSTRWRVIRASTILLGIVVILGGMVLLLVHALDAHHTPRVVRYPAHEYLYMEREASNGFKLHVLQTQPSNITFETIRNNLSLSDYYGINGGFFYESALLSMAVVNGNPVAGAPNHYGSGSENAKYPRGTLVWDEIANKLSVQVVSTVSELQVRDRAHFWAQGGISMSLGLDEEWLMRAQLENAPNMDEDRLRTAAVYDNSGRLYLVVSSTKGTLEAFRTAIIEQVGAGQLADGIFLDGDGSSQMQVAETVLPGDNRPVVQMIRLIH
ncbi:phosphodiester glycosidase family protein [Paenibacillus lignilyticus]|uniref:Phosphodiester glycosidase domain-containing protein n=1 Tax=Paenibacillus lignilyticus TaxID=1172615 RepID=A0ABS5CDA0_9BACL|nr:phosphodiester glycosidase family protein [Paenibacillus lignilyticus]MBP3963903.1 hypothetical protein [Paenibacillus lignilyticus]